MEGKHLCHILLPQKWKPSGTSPQLLPEPGRKHRLLHPFCMTDSFCPGKTHSFLEPTHYLNIFKQAIEMLLFCWDTVWINNRGNAIFCVFGNKNQTGGMTRNRWWHSMLCEWTVPMLQQRAPWFFSLVEASARCLKSTTEPGRTVPHLSNSKCCYTKPHYGLYIVSNNFPPLMDAAVQSKSSATVLFFFRCPSYSQLTTWLLKGVKRKLKTTASSIYSIEIYSSPFFVLKLQAKSPPWDLTFEEWKLFE